MKELPTREVTQPAMVLLPTPPLALETATTRRTPGIGRFSGKPLCIRGIEGALPDLGKPWRYSNERNVFTAADILVYQRVFVVL